MGVSGPAVLLVENRGASHSGYYLRFLIEYLQDRDGPSVAVLLPPTLREKVPGLEDSLRALAGVESHWMDPAAWERTRRAGPVARLLFRSEWLTRHFKLRLRYLKRWLLARSFIDRSAAPATLVLSLDDALIPMLLFPPRRARNVSGMYFKAAEPSGKGRFRRRLERRLFAHLLDQPWAGSILLLDPDVATELEEKFPNRVYHLPEPAKHLEPAPARVEALKRELALQDGRIRFVLAGSLSARRGVFSVLEAAQLLSPEHARRASLLLVGPATSRDETRIEDLCRTLADSELEVRRIARRFPSEDLPLFYSVADVALVTHLHHVGSSGNLVFAAAAGTPTIATEEGMIGRLVRRHSLGLSVDGHSPEDLCTAIEGVVDRAGQVPGFDEEAARDFADRNSPEEYAAAVWRAITAQAEEPKRVSE